MTLSPPLARLLEDRAFVSSHRRFVAASSRGPFSELSKIMWREPSGALASTPWGPTSLAWAVARTCLELQDEAEQEAGLELARMAAFTDEERSAVRA